MIRKYLRYYLRASNGKGHGMHSPFVFDFITYVLNDNTKYPEYQKVEELRRRLKKDDRSILVEDFGAGSIHASGAARRVGEIARHAAKPPKFGQLLFRMIRHYKLTRVLELGTSLGITTGYLGLTNPAAHIITLEGAPGIAAVAKENLETLGLKNVEILVGNFDDTLPAFLKNNASPDLVFIDGNHRYEPTLRYFRELLAVAGNETMLVFDDIHWSAEMERAWEEIKQHPAVTGSIDLFFIGIVLLRKEFREKQQFEIRF